MVVLGIDLGSLNSVIATVQRGAVTVVTTELSERFTPTLVGFTEERRLLADHAAAQLKSNAKNTCRYFKNVLGEPYEENCACQARERQLGLGNLVPVPPHSVLGYKVHYRGKEEMFSAECITAAFLTKLTQVAEGSLKKQVSEVVVGCPPWYRDCHRTALLNACRIAGLTCLRIISDMAAAALDYGMYRRNTFSNDNPQIVAFVGTGHSSTSACIVAFWSDRLTLLAEVSDRELGARDFCFEIMRHFASVFQKMTGDDPLTNLKARLKLEDQAMRAQKILSANTETQFHVECLMGDNDCSGQLTRGEFEQLCGEKLIPRMQKLLQKALDQSGIRREELASVEVIGGGTRIPCVRRAIAEFFKRDISCTLSADETVARGCALQAAMASSSFRVKEYAFGERCLFPFAVSWNDSGPGPTAVLSLNTMTGQPLAQQPITRGGGGVVGGEGGGGGGDSSSSGGSGTGGSGSNNTNTTAATAGGEKEKMSIPTSTTATGEPCIILPPGTDANTIHKMTFFRRGPFTVKVSYNDLPPTSPQAQLDKCHIKLPSTPDLQEVQVYAELNCYGLMRFKRVCVKQRREGEEEKADRAYGGGSSTSTTTATASSPPGGGADTMSGGGGRASAAGTPGAAAAGGTAAAGGGGSSDNNSSSHFSNTSAGGVGGKNEGFPSPPPPPGGSAGAGASGNTTSASSANKYAGAATGTGAAGGGGDMKTNEDMSRQMNNSAFQQQQEHQQQQQQTGAGAAGGSGYGWGGHEKGAGRMQQRSTKIDIPFEVEAAPGRTTAQQLQQYREAELKMETDDRVACEKMERINEVETYMYTLRDALQHGGKMTDFASGDEKRRLEQLYEATQQWIEHVMIDIGSVTRNAILQKLQQLHDIGDRIESRYDQFQGRKDAEQSLNAAIMEARLACQSHDELYAHVPVAERRRVHDFAEHAETWLSEVMTKQHALPPYADPVVTVEDIRKRKEELIRLMQKVFAHPKARSPAPQYHHRGGEVPPEQQDCDMQVETNAENIEGAYMQDGTRSGGPKTIPIEDPDAAAADLPSHHHHPQQSAA